MVQALAMHADADWGDSLASCQCNTWKRLEDVLLHCAQAVLDQDESDSEIEEDSLDPDTAWEQISEVVFGAIHKFAFLHVQG